mmetsp:Transcript_17695/g.33556  ORF Transcript_17695/g.33556 Transcript_17695/m.33556 type:complete len:103 (+) Transcript_17695:3-311(+)
MARLLLRHGANPTQQSDRGWSALHQATRLGHTGLVEAIVTTTTMHSVHGLWNVLWGCNRLHDTKWKSPLAYAADLGYLDIVRLLIIPRIVELCHEGTYQKDY